MYDIAVIEDHQDSREFLEFSLSSEGDFRVTGFGSAEDAVASLRAGATFDVLISDIRMPGMDGLEFIRVVREDLHFVNLPAIAVSAHAYDAARLVALRMGFDEYLRKPLDITGLVSCIRLLLQNRTE